MIKLKSKDLFAYINHYAAADLPALWSGGAYLSYRELVGLVSVLQEEIADQGITQGDPVILSAPRQLDFVVYFLTLLSLGCWVIPMDPKASDNDVREAMILTNGKILTTDGIVMAKVKNLKHHAHGGLKYCAEEGGIYHRTSGTTGVPKFCVRPTERLVEEGRMYIRSLSLDSNDRLLSMSPLFHSFALGAALISSVVAGSCLYTLDRLNFHRVLQIAEDNKVTVLFAVPALIRLLTQVDKNTTYDLSGLQCVLVGAGELTKDICDCFYQRFKTDLSSNYGSTETGGIITRIGSKPFGSIGRCHEGVQIKICDEMKRQVPTGCVGELYVRCGCMMTQYLHQDQSPLDSDGFFATGDLAYQDPSQYIYIKGRKKLMVNIGGKKYSIEEVERTVLQYGQIEDVAVAIRKDGKSEESLVAYIISDKAINGAALRKYCAEHIDPRMILSHIYRVKELPRSDNGKLIRTKLDTLQLVGEIND